MKTWNSSSTTLLWGLFVGLVGSGVLFSSLADSSLYIYELKLISLSAMEIPIVLVLDVYSSLFLLTVMLISLSVFVFGRSYMAPEVNFMRFHLILLSFVASMLLLILSPGLISLFLGWDGLGLTSFLLVMYYNNPKSLNAAMLTVLTNRLGDAFILLALFLGILSQTFSLLTASQGGAPEGSLILVALLVMGAFTKSAQVPFSAWLPAAMAAPTPVSSLVHSSTLVTAGVYVLIRAEGLIPPMGKKIILIAGGLTMTTAGMSALKEGDMKKIVALSTLSQLGVMVIGLGLGSPSLAFFHLIAHAFFKALLFVAAGNTIHAALSYQDLKIMGSKAQPLPLTSSILLVAKASLCGLPFFSGFFSKEAILEGLDSLAPSSLGAYILMIMGVMLTQLYSFRFIKKVLVNLANYYPLHQSSDNDSLVNCAMMILLLPAFMGGSSLLSLSLFKTNLLLTSSYAKTFVVLSIFVSCALVLFMFQSSPHYASWVVPVFSLWLMPQFSGRLALQSTKVMGDYLSKLLSGGFLDTLLGPWTKTSASLWSVSANIISPTLLRHALLLMLILWVIFY